MNSFWSTQFVTVGRTPTRPRLDIPIWIRRSRAPSMPDTQVTALTADGRLYVGGSNQPAAAQHQHQSTVYAHHQHQTHQSGIGPFIRWHGDYELWDPGLRQSGLRSAPYFINPEQDGMYYHHRGFQTQNVGPHYGSKAVAYCGAQEPFQPHLTAPWMRRPGSPERLLTRHLRRLYRPPKGGNGTRISRHLGRHSIGWKSKETLLNRWIELPLWRKCSRAHTQTRAIMP